MSMISCKKIKYSAAATYRISKLRTWCSDSSTVAVFSAFLKQVCMIWPSQFHNNYLAVNFLSSRWLWEIEEEYSKMANLNISKLRYVFLSVNISGVYIALGLLISLQPPFYPSEAEKMGATPAEYGFVFGIANLSLFLFSPVFGAYATRIGPKTCFNCGAVLQGVSGFLFAFLPYCSTTGLFIGLSYLLRFLEGLGKSKH